MIQLPDNIQFFRSEQITLDAAESSFLDLTGESPYSALIIKISVSVAYVNLEGSTSNKTVMLNTTDQLFYVPNINLLRTTVLVNSTSPTQFKIVYFKKI